MSNSRDAPCGAHVLLVIPCWNESAAIDDLLNEIEALGQHDWDVVVVDDGSTDGSGEIAAAHSEVRVVHHLANLGIGATVQNGIKVAYDAGYAACVQVDGDGQHDPGQIPRLLEVWRASKANLVIGSRYLEGAGFQSSLARRLGGRLTALVINSLYGRALTDPTSGFRLMDRQAMALFSRAYPHDYPEPISIARALQQGLTVTEVPVKMRARHGGRSSVSGIKNLIYMIRVTGYVLIMRLGGQL